MAEENAATIQTIGRQELSKRIAKEAQLSQKQAAEVLEATLTAIREALQNGEEVRLVGFGSFKVRQSAARKGVNPRNRQPIEVPSKERVRFFPGKELAEAVLKK
jgi:DNA-binding protein HU-beta